MLVIITGYFLTYDHTRAMIPYAYGQKFVYKTKEVLNFR